MRPVLRAMRVTIDSDEPPGTDSLAATATANDEKDTPTIRQLVPPGKRQHWLVVLDRANAALQGTIGPPGTTRLHLYIAVDASAAVRKRLKQRVLPALSAFYRDVRPNSCHVVLPGAVAGPSIAAVQGHGEAAFFHSETVSKRIKQRKGRWIQGGKELRWKERCTCV